LNQLPKEEKQSAFGGGSQHPEQTLTGEAASTGKSTTKKPQVKRLKNSPSKSIVQVKDAVVWQQLNSMSKKLVDVEKMTSYKTKKQNDNNAPFQTCLCTFDGINVHPDKLTDVDQPRDLPLYTVALPKAMTMKEAGAKIEALGKAMQDSGYRHKRNKEFDLMVFHEDSKALHAEAHYGSKVTKRKRWARMTTTRMTRLMTKAIGSSVFIHNNLL
jgi:hypothetical protein